MNILNKVKIYIAYCVGFLIISNNIGCTMQMEYELVQKIEFDWGLNSSPIQFTTNSGNNIQYQFLQIINDENKYCCNIWNRNIDVYTNTGKVDYEDYEINNKFRVIANANETHNNLNSLNNIAKETFGPNYRAEVL